MFFAERRCLARFSEKIGHGGWMTFSRLLLWVSLFTLGLHAAEPFAVYCGDVELKSRDGLVISWGNLTRIHGAPRVWKVSTPGGVKEVVRFEGASAVWQAVSVWGRVDGARTIVALARVGGEGVLCDGSTRSGADAIDS